MKSEHEENRTSEPTGADLDRRNALKKMGKYGAYTAPVMMTLMVSQKATAASVTEGRGHQHRHGKGRGRELADAIQAILDAWRRGPQA